MEPIGALWVGNKLSDMEQLSIRSFLANGHQVHLFIYVPCSGIPEGTTIRDANEILPWTEIARYPSLPNFSDIFRWKLIQKTGMMYCDLDTICLRPFDFQQPYVFSCELLENGIVLTDASPLKAPADSEFITEAIRRCEAQDSQNPKGKIMNGCLAFGPELVDDLVKELGLTEYILPQRLSIPFSAGRYET